jgi:mono/diheme cytochrome c family protein
MKYFSILIMCIFALVTAGLISCDLGPESPKGFSLPEGSSEEGKLVFLKYQCLACHRINGLKPVSDPYNNPDISVVLGGKSIKVKTYADLLTSIINPSHKLSKGYRRSNVQVDEVSKMTIYNDAMTVTELVNLVTYLESNYELVPYQRTYYHFYGY